jgi:hypothetical protein
MTPNSSYPKPMSRFPNRSLPFKRRGNRMSTKKSTTKSQRELVIASLRRGVGKDNCAGGKHGAGAAPRGSSK